MKNPQNKPPEPRIITTMRLPPDLVAALDAAAEDDDRSRTSMAVKILSTWLKENKYLK